MATDWNQEAEGPPKLNEGYHRVEVAKVIRTKGQDKKPLVNKDDVPFMLVVVEDGEGVEASSSFTIDKSKKFFLGRLLVACGVADKFTEEGVEIEDFEDEDTAKRLEGCGLWVRVTHNGQYANFEPLPEGDVPADAIQAAKAARKGTKKASPEPATVGGGNDDDEDDIPFAPDVPRDF